MPKLFGFCVSIRHNISEYLSLSNIYPPILLHKSFAFTLHYIPTYLAEYFLSLSPFSAHSALLFHPGIFCTPAMHILRNLCYSLSFTCILLYFSVPSRYLSRESPICIVRVYVVYSPFVSLCNILYDSLREDHVATPYYMRSVCLSRRV